MNDNPQPLPSGPGASANVSRYGPSLSLLGLALWGATMAVYYVLKPEDVLPGDRMEQGEAFRLVGAFILASLGVFAAWIVSAVGLFLSLSERRHQPGRRATRGVVLGGIGVAAVMLVAVEILRLVFVTS